MPLQIDRLIATSVDAQTITSNGAPVGGQSSLFFGEIITGATYTTVTSTETIVGSTLMPANTIKGISYPPYLEVAVNVDAGMYEDLILKFYVSETPSIDGITPLEQRTFNDEPGINFGVQLFEAYNNSAYPGGFNFMEFKKNKLIVQSTNLTGGFKVDIFDNFDVSKDLYLTVTAEKLGSPVGVSIISFIMAPFGK